MTKPLVVSQRALVGSARYGLRNTCVFKGVITNPAAFRQMPLTQNPFVTDAKAALHTAADTLLAKLAQECTKTSDDPCRLPATKSLFHFAGKGNSATTYVALRVIVPDAVAERLDDLAAARAAEPATDGKPGRPGKPEGVIDLPWGHGGNRVELCWESRPTPQLRRISGLPEDTLEDALAEFFSDAGLEVKVALARAEGKTCPMVGTFDLTFAAGSQPPVEIVLEDDDGKRTAVKLTRVPLIRPDPAPYSWPPPPPATHPSPAAPTAAALAAGNYRSYGCRGHPLPKSYAAAAATPGAPGAGAAAKPTAYGSAKAAAPGRAPTGKAAAAANAAKVPKRKRPETAAKPAAAPKATAPPAPSPPGSRERLPDTLDRCSHCCNQGHTHANCPNINAMDWTPPADTPAGATDLPSNMETDAAAPSAGEQGPPAAVTASPNQDGPPA
jgi:hypothetical protein